MKSLCFSKATNLAVNCRDSIWMRRERKCKLCNKLVRLFQKKRTKLEVKTLNQEDVPRHRIGCGVGQHVESCHRNKVPPPRSLSLPQPSAGDLCKEELGNGHNLREHKQNCNRYPDSCRSNIFTCWTLHLPFHCMLNCEGCHFSNTA